MLAPDGLELDTSTEEDVDVITLSGEIDFGNVSKLRGALIDLARSGHDLEIRMDGVSFLDSTALGVLVQGRKRLEEAGRELRLTGVRSRVKRTLEVAGLADYLGV
ncbi:MAG TPA: STAS domain-containing protein [Acidimicrobiia bacterium]|nr:STAS domain-containing protein [Acidimicrobiia bacterium]